MIKPYVIICLSHIQIRNLNYFRRKTIIFHTKTKKFGHVKRVTSRNTIRLTSANVTRKRHPGMITSPRLNYLISRRADNQRAGNTISHMQNLGYRRN